MTERPILFSAPMVRAIRDDSKTQTRRIVKPPSSVDCRRKRCAKCGRSGKIDLATS